MSLIVKNLQLILILGMKGVKGVFKYVQFWKYEINIPTIVLIHDRSQGFFMSYITIRMERVRLNY